MTKKGPHDDINQGAWTMTRQGFQDRIEQLLIGARGEYCKAQIANENEHISLYQRWQNEVDRLLFVELSFFVGAAKPHSVSAK